MRSPANEVIQGLILGESAMTTFVGKNPKSSSNASLEETVGSPSHNAQLQGWYKMDVQRSIDQSGAVEDVSS